MPLCLMVTPQLLPFPLGVAVMTAPAALQVALMFQVARTRAGPDMVMVTIQLLVPVTLTLRLYRSLQIVPADSVAVQLPPPGGGEAEGDADGEAGGEADGLELACPPDAEVDGDGGSRKC